MVVVGSLLCFEEPATGPYLSQMNPVTNFPTYFCKIHSNIIFPSTHRSSKWSLPFKFLTRILYIFIISPVHITRYQKASMTKVTGRNKLTSLQLIQNLEITRQ